MKVPVRTPESEARDAIHQYMNKEAVPSSSRPVYVRKRQTVVVQAMQWTGDNFDRIVAWMGGNNVRLVNPDYPGKSGGDVLEVYNWIDPRPGGMWIPVAKGDWIIRGVKGEYYPCDNEVFVETYEVVS